jgi:hypothetical protein
MMSFGPGEPIWSHTSEFKSGNLPGDSGWPLKGNLSTWETNISKDQLTNGLKDLNAFNANPPNYTTSMQCTSAVLGLASRIGVNLPSGSGPVTARVSGITLFNGNSPNPYALSVAMTRAFGAPYIVPASSFPSPSGGSKW